MHTPICDELGIEFPIFAFTHCRDVVVAVSKAGGFGVLGAVGFTPEQLQRVAVAVLDRDPVVGEDLLAEVQVVLRHHLAQRLGQLFGR